MATPRSTSEVLQYNRDAWDRLASQGNQWTVPATAESVHLARMGEPKIVLTPKKIVPKEWLMPLAGKDVLCLAGGGGQQAPILAAAGANVTTLDNSQAQLDQDLLVAKRESLSIKTVLGLMDDLSAFAEQSFDLIVHPCSNSFTPDVRAVWREAFRVTRPGGSIISGFTNPAYYLFDYRKAQQGNLVVKHKIPYSDLQSLSEAERQHFIDEGEPLEFGHTLADQIGGQLAAGFSLADMYEDNWPEGAGAAADYFDPFIATRSVRLA